MLQKLKVNRMLWLLAGVLALAVSLIGLSNQGIYSNVVTPQWLPGTISQDIVTAFSATLLIFLSVSIKETQVKLQILALSLLFYLFYGYGIYVIEQLYNLYYLLYVVIFALSFWSLVYGLINLKQDVLKRIEIGRIVRYLSIGFSLFIPLLFYTLWTSQLIPLMQTGNKIEFTYSIYILDMVFILPAIIISAVLAIKKAGLGFILLPIMFFKAFTLLFSVGLGGVLKPYYNQPTSAGETWFYISLSSIFLSLAILNLWKLKMAK